jgi:hypothetical protein
MVTIVGICCQVRAMASASPRVDAASGRPAALSSSQA